MKYNFDKTVNRMNTDCYKYDGVRNFRSSTKHDEAVASLSPIALWVADMDFETAPCITDALKKRLEHGCFGYTKVPESYYQATINWFSRRHGWNGIHRDWFIYTSGVVPAVSAIIKALTVPGDKVLIQSPVYNCFFSSIKNNGCRVADAPLCLSADNQYTIDFEAFEKKCADPKVKVFLLCNPHNPAGRVWSAEELKTMGEICKRHDVFVVSDEIHCEFVNEGHRFVPFMSVSDAPCAVCLSPSKAFNIAGLQIANIVCKDESIRRRINRAININEVCDVNPFGVIALQAAYSEEGEEWLDELNHYIYANYNFAKSFIEQNMPQWGVIPLEGTYLMWVKIDGDADALTYEWLKKYRVYINSGSMYDHKDGKHFIRINIATQRAQLEEGLKRICKIQ